MIRKRFATVAFAAPAICILSWTPTTNAQDDADATSSLNATISLTNFQAASVVVGQPDLSHNDINQAAARPPIPSTIHMETPASGPTGCYIWATSRTRVCSDFSRFRRPTMRMQISHSDNGIWFHNRYRCHTGLAGLTPAQRSCALSPPTACLDSYHWRRHCNGLFQTPAAA